MAFVLKFSIIFCTLLYSASYCLLSEHSGDFKIAEPSLATICADYLRQARSNKLICVFCRGFHPECFIKTTTTSTSTTALTTSTTPFTTTTPQPSTTTIATTTTTTPQPSTTTIATTTTTAATTVSSTAATRTDEEPQEE